MKKSRLISYIFVIIMGAFLFCPNCTNLKVKAETSTTGTPMLAIIIDDFGSYDQSGVETMLSIDAPITCAIMPNVDNTKLNVDQISASNKEIILHMPMQACVNLPLSWYGTNYISFNDSKEQVYKKLDDAFESVSGAKGFNIHIGSGLCQNEKSMSYVYDYAKENNLCFVDSRTHLNTLCDKVAESKEVVYLGRDEFLEPSGDRSYEGVKKHLMIGAQLAKDRGYAIVIGHVGVHGGENTAKAIKDSIDNIRKMGVEIVPLSKLYNNLNSTYVHGLDKKAPENTTNLN